MLVPVLPAGIGLDLFAQLGAQVGVTEGGQERRRTAGVVPRVQERAQADAVAHVRVDVGRDVHAGGADRVDQREGFVHEGPVALAGRLEVVDVDGYSGAFADGDGLADGFENRVALVPHVREVDAIVLAGHRTEGYQLFRGRVDRGRIDQGRGHADGSILHPLSYERLHLLELLGRRRNVLVAEHHAPHLGQADVVDHVDRDAVALEDREVLGVAAPAEGVAVDHGRIAQRGVALGRGRTALAGEVGGDALAQLAFGARGVGDEDEAGLAHHVDEAGGDHSARGVDGAGGFAVRQLAHSDDAIAAQSDIGVYGRPAGSVDHAGVGDEDVEGGIVSWGSGVGAGGGEENAGGGQGFAWSCLHAVVSGSGTRGPGGGLVTS